MAVETAARNQICLILGHLMTESEDAFKARIEAIYSSHAAQGRLKSGSTVKVALRAADDLSSNLISNAVNQVAPVAKDVEAFAMICESVDRYLSQLAVRMDAVASMASGNPVAISKHDSVVLATKREFQALRENLTRRLEIHRFSFTQPGHQSIAFPQPSTISKPRKGGRPPAEFWDDMWAAIAVSLYSGDLTPKSQADVERAMTEWIEANGQSAANSTIRARARRLWDQISTVDD